MGSLSFGIHPIKNVHMLCFRHLLRIGTTHRNVYSLSYPKCGFVPLCQLGLRGNPVIGCTRPMSFPLLLFVPQLCNWVPSKLSYPLLECNIRCFQQFFGCVWCLLCQALVSHWWGGGLVLQCQISWVWVRTDNSALWKVCCACTLVVSWWPIPALIWTLFGGRNPTRVWYHSISFLSNLWWACMSYLCWKLNDPHCPDLHILCQNCPQQVWRKWVMMHGTTCWECWHSRNIRMGQIYIGAVCWQENPLAVSPTLLLSPLCVSLCLMPILWGCIDQLSTLGITTVECTCTWSIQVMSWGKSFFMLRHMYFAPFVLTTLFQHSFAVSMSAVRTDTSPLCVIKLPPATMQMQCGLSFCGQ